MEVASIVLSMLVGLGILLAGLLSGGKSAAAGVESLEVTAQASAMPDQGWAPRMVYFGAYGSRSSGAQIARYEWDLDGDGSATSTPRPGGLRQLPYSHPGDYTITLRVTDTQGRFASDRIPVGRALPGCQQR
jgi:PKD repeat protein